MIYRVPLNGAEIGGRPGRPPPAEQSRGFRAAAPGKPEVDSEVENRAQSASRVFFRPRDTSREIARLKTAINRQDGDEIVYIDPNEKKPGFYRPGNPGRLERRL